MREITILRTFDRLCSNEKRRNRCDLIEVFKMFYGYSERDIRVLVTLDGNDKGLRGHSKKIRKPRFNADITKYFFSNRVIDRWNSLNQDTVDATCSRNCFNNRLKKLGAQEWVASWTSPLNPRPCHVG